MKTAKENARFHKMGERLQELILIAVPESDASVRYDEFTEFYCITAFGHDYEQSVALDSPMAALKDIGKFLSRGF